jgi:hypothetical protein
MERARYPPVAEVPRKWKDHEELTGHSVVVNGW